MFAKPLRQLKPDDLQVAIGRAENDQLEFKSTIPSKDGRPDTWETRGNSVGDYGRNQLLAEIIAFANAHGGTLIVGIKETSTQPRRAEAIAPIPKCIALAERLRQMARDCIDPQIPVLEIEGVEIEEDAGIVIVRTDRSRLAPHRLTTTLECYVRRADRTERMTMREIHDLTLQIDRGLASIDRKFEARASLFNESVDTFYQGSKGGCFAMRFTLIPMSPLYVDKVHRNPEVDPPFLNLTGTLNGKPLELYAGRPPANWRRIMGGTYGRTGDDEAWPIVTVMRDGFIEYQMMLLQQQDPGNSRKLYPGWFMSLIANALLAAVRFRNAAGAPSTEYGVEIQIIVRGKAVPVVGYGRSPWAAEGHIGGYTNFPRYSLGATEELAALCGTIERDFWDSIDVESSPSIEIDFATPLTKLGLA